MLYRKPPVNDSCWLDEPTNEKYVLPTFPKLEYPYFKDFLAYVSDRERGGIKVKET